ncbi:MAG: 4Fe-4S binding protein [Spirochaetales bacterium]|jgi:ferredoxin|nr:EFR1 family ferrodoxin [Spirochaetota bacterium]NLL25302.1 4Fe-4S binding protein [Spirochaetales bacterium]
MNHTILCFSGTGNSYHVANRLRISFENARIVMIPDLMDDSTVELTEAVGLVFPTYFFLPPATVVEFIETVLPKLDLSPVQYFYVVTTKNLSGGWAHSIAEILLRDRGVALSYASSVRFPNTYIPLFTAPNIMQIEFYYKHAERKILKIAQEIRKETIRPPFRPPFTRYMLEERMGRRFEKVKKSAQASFVVTSKCDGCEFCYRICPTGNIEMVYGKPIFRLNCTGCLGCYHRCPRKAITFNRRVSTGHYPNHEAHFDKEYRE